MIELVIDNYKNLAQKNYIFVFDDEECIKFHIDSSVKILSPSSNVIRLSRQTAGALCTCLMAVDYINNDTQLIIANCDQIIDVDYNEVVSYFEKIGADAGVITFPNIHPRWSYARKSGSEVVEVAEKRPLSKNAIAGFYYYKSGKDAILKQNHVEGRYYISASINEIILAGKKVGYFDIQKEQYKSFYSPTKIKEYEESLK